MNCFQINTQGINVKSDVIFLDNTNKLITENDALLNMDGKLIVLKGNE